MSLHDDSENKEDWVDCGLQVAISCKLSPKIQQHLIYMANKKSSERKDSRKSSSGISEKSAPLPDEKKSRNEPSEEGEDEVLTEVNMAEHLKVRLDQNIPQLSALEKNLDKLGVIKLEIQKVNAKI